MKNIEIEKIITYFALTLSVIMLAISIHLFFYKPLNVEVFAEIFVVAGPLFFLGYKFCQKYIEKNSQELDDNQDRQGGDIDA